MQVTSSDFGDMNLILDFAIGFHMHVYLYSPVGNFETIASKILAFVTKISSAECNFLVNWKGLHACHFLHFGIMQLALC